MLLAAYVITGCDTMSYPFRVGNKQALKATPKCLDCLGPLANYVHEQGNSHVEDDVISSAEQFFFALYGSKGIKRFHLFPNKKGDIRCLPPTEDAFRLYLLRVFHQLTVCKCALEIRK